MGIVITVSLLLSVLMGYMGRNRRIGFVGFFLLNVVLTPLFFAVMGPFPGLLIAPPVLLFILLVLTAEKPSTTTKRA